MLYRKGADPEALDRVARELTACAGEVEVIRANGTRALAVLGRSWGGADADAAQESWRATSTALSSLGSTLDRMAARLGDNARAQRSASGGPGSLLTPGPCSRSGSAGRPRSVPRRRPNRPSPTGCGAPSPRRSISSSPSWPRASTTARAPRTSTRCDPSSRRWGSTQRRSRVPAASPRTSTATRRATTCWPSPAPTRPASTTGRPTPSRAWAASARSTSRPSLSPSTSPLPSAARTWC